MFTLPLREGRINSSEARIFPGRGSAPVLDPSPKSFRVVRYRSRPQRFRPSLKGGIMHLTYQAESPTFIGQRDFPMTADLTNPIFTNEDAARKHFEALRWPDGPICPHCGVVGEATELQASLRVPVSTSAAPVRRPFTATMGTLYERSHIPLHKWLLATHLLCASKKGISAHQLWRMLGFGSYRTAWFMAHRIREGMASLAGKAARLVEKVRLLKLIRPTSAARKRTSTAASATRRTSAVRASKSFTRWLSAAVAPVRTTSPM